MVWSCCLAAFTGKGFPQRHSEIDLSQNCCPPPGLSKD